MNGCAEGPIDSEEVHKDRDLELSGILKREEVKRLTDRIMETLQRPRASMHALGS
jgi:hypothetical protein